MSTVSLRCSKERGRHFAASQFLAAGTLLLRISPVASSLLDEELTRFCSGCFQPSFAEVRRVSRSNICPECRRVFFCKECRQATESPAAAHADSGECALLRRTTRSDTLHVRFLLRLARFRARGSSARRAQPYITLSDLTPAGPRATPPAVASDDPSRIVTHGGSPTPTDGGTLEPTDVGSCEPTDGGTRDAGSTCERGCGTPQKNGAAAADQDDGDRTAASDALSRLSLRNAAVDSDAACTADSADADVTARGPGAARIAPVSSLIDVERTPVCDSWDDVMALEAGTNDPHTLRMCVEISRAALLECPQIGEQLGGAAAVERLVQVMVRNAHEIGHPHRIGIGLFPTGAVFNHDCRPNAVFFHDNSGCLCFRAVRDIPAGAEICSAYIDPYQPTRLRQRELQARYAFVCRCERCLDPDSDRYVSGFVCPKCRALLAPDHERPGTLSCTQCGVWIERAKLGEAEATVLKYQDAAVEASNRGSYTDAMSLATQAFTVGSKWLHPWHHAMLGAYQCIAVSAEETGQPAVSVAFIRRQLDCLHGVFAAGGPHSGCCLLAETKKWHQLALALQQHAQQAAQSSDASTIITESLKAFETALEKFKFLLGQQH
eukprot:TRINITY_DN27814_c0_g1_i1.p1 TRINITY_DN27814_c0_g1~~TRINITY_DN27814_c0_g1_i1.p1  ORF type:complete len:623 (-),score=91.14 TRINITY_DN27814_c0_g1_i1:54-1874(-)